MPEYLWKGEEAEKNAAALINTFSTYASQASLPQYGRARGMLETRCTTDDTAGFFRVKPSMLGYDHEFSSDYIWSLLEKVEPVQSNLVDKGRIYPIGMADNFCYVIIELDEGGKVREHTHMLGQEIDITMDKHIITNGLDSNHSFISMTKTHKRKMNQRYYLNGGKRGEKKHILSFLIPDDPDELRELRDSPEWNPYSIMVNEPIAAPA